MRKLLELLMAAALALCVTGCPSYTSVGNGLGVSSPDGRFSLAVEIDGALGHAYVDKTPKKIWIEILNGTNENSKVLFHHSYRLAGSDVDWQIHWSSPEEVSIEFYDWGDGVSNYNNMKHMTASNHIALLSFILDKRTGKFIEKK